MHLRQVRKAYLLLFFIKIFCPCSVIFHRKKFFLIPFIVVLFVTDPAFYELVLDDSGHFVPTKSRRTFRRNIIGAGQNRLRTKSAKKKNELTLS